MRCEPTAEPCATAELDPGTRWSPNVALPPLAETTTPASALHRRAVGVMFFVAGAAYANWLARIPAVRDTLGLNERELGMLLLAGASGALVAFRFAGRLIARYGSRRVTRLAGTLFCAFLALPTCFANAVGSAVALFWVGAASGLMDVAMNAQAVEVERAHTRQILSLFHGLFSLGGLVGAMMGGAAAALGVAAPLHLALAGLILLIPTVVYGAALLPFTPAESPPSTTARPTGKLLALGAVVFCSSVGEGAMADWSAVYLLDVLHTTAGVAALGFAFYSVAMLVGRFTGDWFTTRFGAVRMVRLGGLVVSGSLGLGLMSQSVAAMFAAFFCVGVGLAVVVPVVFRCGGQLPGVAPGAALATLATLSYSAFLLGPPVIGFIAANYTLRGGLAVVAVLALVLSCLASAVATPVNP